VRFVDDDVFGYVLERDGVGGGLRRRGAGLRREGAEGDLEAVEDHAGALEVDGVVGDGVHDLGDGGADGFAVLGFGEIEEPDAGAAGAGVGDGAAGGVVVVAELLGAEAGAAAAAAGGEDVAAAAAGGLIFVFFVFGFVERHVGIPPTRIFFSQNLGKRRVRSGLGFCSADLGSGPVVERARWLPRVSTSIGS
jgi:hypothetical protein